MTEADVTDADRPTLVIGVGNRDRGDDGIGPVIATSVGEVLGGRVVTFAAEGDLSDLSMRWTPDHDVIVVDAMVSGREPGSAVEIDALASRLPVEAGLLSSHGVGLGEAVELARLLGRLPHSLTVVAVETVTFEQFDPVSDEVSARIPALVELVIDRIDALPARE